MTSHVTIGNDHAGFALKTALASHLEGLGYAVDDVGSFDASPVDYPDYAGKVAARVVEGRGRGILICGSGVGASVAANKVPGVRAGLAHDTYSAHQGVEHDDMNVLVLGARVIGVELAKDLVTTFLAATFSGAERHLRRLAKVAAIELRHARLVDLRVAEGGDAFAEDAAEAFAACAAGAIARSGRFAVAVSGGSTPARVFDRLASAYRDRIDWPRVHLFWADERPVPPTNARSNYRLVKDHLLDAVALPNANVHRIPTEHGPQAAARAYDDEIARFFALAPGERPRFDLIFLGVGEDGHTASLFPGSPALLNATDLAVANDAGAVGETRVTLTYPVLNAARHVVVLATGEGKQSVVRDALMTPPDPARLPIQGVNPLDGRLTWIVDRAAAPEPSA